MTLWVGLREWAGPKLRRTFLPSSPSVAFKQNFKSDMVTDSVLFTVLSGTVLLVTVTEDAWGESRSHWFHPLHSTVIQRVARLSHRPTFTYG